MQRHIVEVLANGNQAFEDFIKRSTAWKFQNAGLPPEVLLALLGGKGVGKGAWGYILLLIFGTHGLQIFSTEHLTGKHNQHLQNKLFLFLDEAIWAGDKHADRVLKGLTTEKSMFIEPKNVNGFQWPNHLGMYMSGNDKWIVPASHDERRYAVNKVSERWKQDKTYFEPLFEEINNGGAGAMISLSPSRPRRLASATTFHKPKPCLTKRCWAWAALSCGTSISLTSASFHNR